MYNTTDVAQKKQKMNKLTLLLCVVLLATTLLLGGTESRYIHFKNGHRIEKRSNSNARDSCKKTAMENQRECYDKAMREGDLEDATDGCSHAYKEEEKQCDDMHPMDIASEI